MTRKRAKKFKPAKHHQPQPKGTPAMTDTDKPDALQPALQPAPALPAGLTPELAQQIMQITAQTIASALPATLAAMGIKSGAPIEEAKTLPPQEDPDFEDGPPSPRFAIGTRLLSRHYDWLQRRAEWCGRSVEDTLEDLVRLAYAADPTKGGTLNVALPTEKGQTATSAPRVAG
jgi:hypothetical protein